MWLASLQNTLKRSSACVHKINYSGAWVILVWNHAFSQLWKFLLDAVWTLEVGVVQALSQDFLEGVYDVYLVYVFL